MADPGAIKVTITKRGDAVVVSPSGEIATHEAPAMRQAIRGALDAKPPRVVIDLGAVSYMATAGLATLVEALQIANRNGAKLVLCSLQDRVRTVFEISRLTSVFRIVENVDQAVA